MTPSREQCDGTVADDGVCVKRTYLRRTKKYLGDLRRLTRLLPARRETAVESWPRPSAPADRLASCRRVRHAGDWHRAGRTAACRGRAGRRCVALLTLPSHAPACVH